MVLTFLEYFSTIINNFLLFVNLKHRLNFEARPFHNFIILKVEFVIIILSKQDLG